jgi:hypothetical protein
MCVLSQVRPYVPGATSKPQDVVVAVTAGHEMRWSLQHRNYDAVNDAPVAKSQVSRLSRK